MARKIDSARWTETLASIGIRTNVPPHLTQRVVDAALGHALGQRYKLPDGKVPDLFLLVGKGDPLTGRTSAAWFIGYRKGGVGRAGTRTTMKIGSADSMNLEQARAAAGDAQRVVDGGLDPAEERRRSQAEGVTVGEYIAGGYTEYMNVKRWLPKTQRKFLNRTRNVWSAIYDRPLRTLPRADVNTILAKRLETGSSNGTVLMDWANLRGVLRQAVQAEAIPVLPFQGTPEAVLGLVRNKRDRFLGQFDTSKDKANGTTEAARLMATLAVFEPSKPRIWGGRFMRALVPLLISTGCRLSEILKLDESMVFLDCDKPHLALPAGGYTKNKKAKRVTLNDDAVTALRGWLEYRATWPQVDRASHGGRGWRVRVVGGGKSVSGTFAAVEPERVVGDQRLFPLTHEYLKGRADYHDWREILKAARIPFGKAANSLRVHDLRHTTSSWLINDGVPIYTVSKVLGHASGAAMTERYSHLQDDTVRDAVMGLRIAGR